MGVWSLGAAAARQLTQQQQCCSAAACATVAGCQLLLNHHTTVMGTVRYAGGHQVMHRKHLSSLYLIDYFMALVVWSMVANKTHRKEDGCYWEHIWWSMGGALLLA
jgi:hypothetical protein